MLLHYVSDIRHMMTVMDKRLKPAPGNRKPGQGPDKDEEKWDGPKDEEGTCEFKAEVDGSAVKPVEIPLPCPKDANMKKREYLRAKQGDFDKFKDQSEDPNAQQAASNDGMNFNALCQDHFNRIHEFSERLAQQSKAQTTLLNTLVE